MKKGEFMRALRSVNMATEAQLEAMLDRHIGDTELDSLDIEILRTVLERQLGNPISEKTWQSVTSLRALMEAI